MSVRATSKSIGMGSSERHWGDVKHIKSGRRSQLYIENMENQSTIYAKARLDKAKFHCDKLEKSNDTCATWGDEDENFNLRIETLGVEVNALKMTSTPKSYFYCCTEDW